MVRTFKNALKLIFWDWSTLLLFELLYKSAALAVAIPALKALLDYAVYFGKKQGKKAIRLDTYEENLPAVRLYEKCGFQERGKVDLGLEPVYGLKWYRVFEKVIG